MSSKTKVKRLDTRSRSFRLSRSFGSNQPPAGPTTPATPGSFHYISRPFTGTDEPIHSAVNLNEYDEPPSPPAKETKSGLSKWWSRLSVSSLIATLFLLVGGAMFTINVKLVSDVYMDLLLEAMHIGWKWLEIASIIVTAMGCLMMALALLIFISTCLFGHDSESGNKSPPLIFLLILYPALPIWLFFFAVSVAFGMSSLVLEGLCNTQEVEPLWNINPPPSYETCQTIKEGEECINCINFYQFNFLFPPQARKEDMWLCGREIWVLCSADLPKLNLMWLLCLIGTILVIIGISVEMMSLTHLRTKLGAERKAKEEHDRWFIKRRINAALSRSSRYLLDEDEVDNPQLQPMISSRGTRN